MTEYYQTTTAKEKVDVPSWAQEYEVGDTIHWESDKVEGVKASEIVGFSTLFDVGYPVIEPPYEHIDGDSNADCVAVTEESVIKLCNNE